MEKFYLLFIKILIMPIFHMYFYDLAQNLIYGTGRCH